MGSPLQHLAQNLIAITARIVHTAPPDDNLCHIADANANYVSGCIQLQENIRTTSPLARFWDPTLLKLHLPRIVAPFHYLQVSSVARTCRIHHDLVQAILEASRSATVAVTAEVVAVFYRYGSFVVDVYGIYLNPD
jgi:hypothetical protein